MKPRIVLEFENSDDMNYWMEQMSDGWGEGLCDFSTCHKKYGVVTPESMDDFEKVYTEGGTLVCAVKNVERY